MNHVEIDATISRARSEIAHHTLRATLFGLEAAGIGLLGLYIAGRNGVNIVSVLQRAQVTGGFQESDLGPLLVVVSFAATALSVVLSSASVGKVITSASELTGATMARLTHQDSQTPTP